jgi:hypothetical protein
MNDARSKAARYLLKDNITQEYSNKKTNAAELHKNHLEHQKPVFYRLLSLLHRFSA